MSSSRPTDKDVNNNTMNETGDEIQLQSASQRKLSLGKEECDSGGAERVSQQWLIIHVARLNELFSELICPKCAGTGLHITIDSENQGFCCSLLLKCTLCKNDNFLKSVYTSTRVHDEIRSDVAFDVNVRMVLLAHELGLGYAALQKDKHCFGDPWTSFENIPETQQKSGRYGNKSFCLFPLSGCVYN